MDEDTHRLTVKMRRSELHLLERPPIEDCDSSDVSPRTSAFHALPDIIAQPSANLQESEDDNPSQPRKIEDQKRRQEMHRLIIRMEEGSKTYAKDFIDKFFRGRDAWLPIGPMRVLVESVGRKIDVMVNCWKQGMHKVVGKLVFFDKQMNLVLKDVTQMGGSEKVGCTFIRGCLVVYIRKA